MEIKIVTETGSSIEYGLQSIFKRVVDKLDAESGKAIAKSMEATVRRHISAKYPGSRHWDPSKVNIGSDVGNVGEVNIDIPGASRAYSDITIRPRFRKALAIPMHSAAYGKAPAEIPDLLVIKKKNGTAFLAQELLNGGLRFMYVLKDQVHQKMDASLLPTDSTLAKNASMRVANIAKRAIQEIIGSV